MAEAELTTIARPYARAAFSQALAEASGLGSWSRMLALLSAAVKEPSVSAALDNPLLTKDSEAEFVIEVMGEELSQQGKNFVHVLADYGRIALLPEIADMYELFKANHEKTMEVQITSAYQIEETDQNILSEALKKRLQREISVSSSVDESLLGGVIIRAEDTVIDNSVRGKLDKLAHALT